MSAGVKWVTLTQAPERKQASTQRAVQSNTFERVGGAGWGEAANRSNHEGDQPRERELVAPDQQQQQACHPLILSIRALCANTSCLAQRAAQRLVQLRAQVSITEIGGTRAQDHDDVCPNREGENSAKPLTNPSFAAVANHGTTHTARRDDA